MATYDLSGLKTEIAKSVADASREAAEEGLVKGLAAVTKDKIKVSGANIDTTDLEETVQNTISGAIEKVKMPKIKKVQSIDIGKIIELDDSALLKKLDSLYEKSFDGGEKDIKQFIAHMQVAFERQLKVAEDFVKGYNSLLNEVGSGTVKNGNRVESDQLSREAKQRRKLVDSIKEQHNEYAKYIKAAKNQQQLQNIIADSIGEVTGKIKDQSNAQKEYNETLKETASLAENIQKIYKNNKMPGNTKEQAMAFDSMTGNTSKLRTGDTASISYKDLTKTKKYDSFLHTHSFERIAAFSFDDILNAAKMMKDNITNQFVASMNEVSHLDFSNLSSDMVKKIGEELKELTSAMVSNGEFAIDDKKAFKNVYGENVQKFIDNLINDIFSEANLNNISFDSEVAKKRIQSSVERFISNNAEFNENDLLKRLYAGLNGAGIKDKNIIESGFDKTIRDMYQQFQENMLKVAFDNLDISDQFDRVFEKMSFPDFAELYGDIDPSLLEKIAKDAESTQKEVKQKAEQTTEALKEQEAAQEKVNDAQKSSPTPSTDVAEQAKKNTEALEGQAEAQKEVNESINKYKELLNKSYSTSGKRDATTQLKDAYKEYKKYYGDGGSASQKIDREKTFNELKAEYDYFKSLQEAFDKKIAKSSIEKYGLGRSTYKLQQDADCINDIIPLLNDYSELIDKINSENVPLNFSDDIDSVENLIKNIVDEKDLLRGRSESNLFNEEDLKSSEKYIKSLEDSLQLLIDTYKNLQNNNPDKSQLSSGLVDDDSLNKKAAEIDYLIERVETLYHSRTEGIINEDMHYGDMLDSDEIKRLIELLYSLSDAELNVLEISQHYDYGADGFRDSITRIIDIVKEERKEINELYSTGRDDDYDQASYRDTGLYSYLEDILDLASQVNSKYQSTLIPTIHEFFNLVNTQTDIPIDQWRTSEIKPYFDSIVQGGKSAHEVFEQLKKDMGWGTDENGLSSGDSAITQMIEDLEKAEQQSKETSEAIQKAIESSKQNLGAGNSLDEMAEAQAAAHREAAEAAEKHAQAEREVADSQEKQDGRESIEKEESALTELVGSIEKVIEAVDQKTSAFQEEGQVVDGVIQGEVSNLEYLSGQLSSLKSDIEDIARAFQEIKFDGEIKTDWVKSLSKLKGADFSGAADSLKAMYESVQNLDIKDSNFLSSIQSILEKSKELEDLAKILSSSTKKIKEASKTENSKDNSDRLKQIKDSYKDQIKAIKEIQKLKLQNLNNEAKDPDDSSGLRAKNESLISSYEEAIKKIKEQRDAIGATEDECSKYEDSVSRAQDEMDQAVHRTTDALKAQSEQIEKIKQESQEAAQAVEKMKDSSNSEDSLFKNALKDIEKLEKQLKKMQESDKYLPKQNIQNLLNSIEAFGKMENPKLKDAQDLVEKLRSGMTELSKVGNLNSLDNALKKIYKRLHENSGMSDELKQKFKDLANAAESLRNNAKSNPPTSDAVQSIISEFNKLEQEMLKTGQTGKSFWEGVGDRINSINQSFIGMAFGFYDFVNYGKQVVQTVTEIDTGLTELRKVSDATGPRLAQSFETSAKTAQELGTTITDVINSTSDWARLGYTIDEAEELSKVTALMQSVGDDMSQQESSDAIIATLKGFQMQADEAMDIVDSYNEISNRFEIDTKSIGEALERSAASFNVAGADMNDAIALITPVFGATRDSEGTGQMWKTSQTVLLYRNMQLVHV